MRTAKRVPLWLKGAVFGIVALHVALVLAVIGIYGNNIPVMDEWQPPINTGVAIRTAQGTLNLSDFFVNYDGHFLFFTLIATSINALLFKYQPQLEMLFTAFLMIVNYCLVAAIWRRQIHSHNKRLFWLSLIPIASMLFAGRWWESWAWGFMNMWQLPITFVLLGILAVERLSPNWRMWIVLTLLSVLASFSHGSGILAFPLLGFWTILRRKFDLTKSFPFAIAGVLCALGLYFAIRDGDQQLIFQPINNLLFITAYLGAVQMSPPALHYVLPSSLASLASVIFLVWLIPIFINIYLLYKSKAIRSAFFPLILILWGISSAAMVSIGRKEMYQEVLHLDYHTPLAIQFWLGSMILSFVVMESQKRDGKAFLTNFFNVAFIAGVQIAFSISAVAFLAIPALRLSPTLTYDRELLLSSIVWATDSPYHFHAIRSTVRESVIGLAEHRLSVFSQADQNPIKVLLRFLPILSYNVAAEDEFRIVQKDSEAQYVLFQRTARLAQSLELPNLPDYHFTLRGALSLESTCADQNIQARLIVDDGQTPRIAIEQTASTDLVPFAIDLTDLRGRAFTLLYELETPEPLACGHVLWANPRIEFSLANIVQVERR